MVSLARLLLLFSIHIKRCAAYFRLPDTFLCPLIRYFSFFFFLHCSSYCSAFPFITEPAAASLISQPQMLPFTEPDRSVALLFFKLRFLWAFFSAKVRIFALLLKNCLLNYVPVGTIRRAEDDPPLPWLRYRRLKMPAASGQASPASAN